MSVPIKHFYRILCTYVYGGYIGKYVLWRNTLSSDESFEMKKKNGRKNTECAWWNLCYFKSWMVSLFGVLYSRFMAKCIYQEYWLGWIENMLWNWFDEVFWRGLLFQLCVFFIFIFTTISIQTYTNHVFIERKLIKISFFQSN